MSRSKKSLNHLKQLHSFIITHGLSNHTSFLTKLLYSPSLYQSNGQLNIINLWNTIISGFSLTSQPQKSILFYIKMLRNGVCPDHQTYPLLLKSYSKLKNQNPFDIYAHVMKFGFEFVDFVRNSLITTMSNCGYVQFARQVFDESSHRDIVAWTAMIDGYVRNDYPVDGVECFKMMRSMGVKADEVTVVSVICAAALVRDIRFGKWIHGFYVVPGRVKSDVFVGSSLVDMYSKCGYCDDARRMFDEMPTRNVVSWSALIDGYVQSSRSRDALILFQDMLLSDVKPNQSTLTSVLAASTRLGALDQGRWVHDYINRNSLEINIVLGTALIDMYAKCGCVSDAYQVFEKLPVKNVHLWTAMINSLAMHGDASSCLNLFDRMIDSGVEPNRVTFIGLLSACAHGGLVDEGQRLFGMMKQKYNLEPSVNHYGCMVDILGRAGHLDKAWKLIEEMPMEPTPGVLGALFGACMKHKAFDLGEHLGKLLIKLQPNHSGRYTLLANMYSAYRNWDAAAHVRKSMQGKGVVKKPGYSWIEVNGKIHEFIALDGSHSESYDIYEMLDKITEYLKLADSLSETSLLTSDIVTFDL